MIVEVVGGAEERQEVRVVDVDDLSRLHLALARHYSQNGQKAKAIEQLKKGLAVSGKMAAARYNTSSHAIFTHKIICLAGDGCLQEGVAAEAAAFAGHFQLDNLIITPHVAWASQGALANLAEQLIQNIEAFVRGSPRNLVASPARELSPR